MAKQRETRIRAQTRKKLWAMSGNRCAFPGCPETLVRDATETDAEAVIGVESHIVSGQKGGPRYDPSFPSSEVDRYANLILLCSNHSRVVDGQQREYTASCLREMKAKHEDGVARPMSEADAPPQ
jgi:hypothetical protein